MFTSGSIPLSPRVGIILISSPLVTSVVILSAITATIIPILASLFSLPLLLNFFVLSLLSGKFLCLLLRLFFFLQDALILRILDILFGRQVLDRVVRHDPHIIDERVVHRTDNYGVNLRCLR